MKNKPVIIVGHKNPDTDSICSAIAYAYLKNKINGDKTHEPRRAGHISTETAFVLKYFGVKGPRMIDTLEPRIKDVTMRKTQGIDEEASLKTAYEQMGKEGLRTLPVFRDGALVGLITQGDIAHSMMEDYDATALSQASVSCKNIVETLDGTLVVGDINSVFKEGKVAIGAANPEKMTQYIEPHAMVIMGNRSDAQISALERGAEWLIVCLGSDVFEIIKKLARETGTNIIVTPHSTYIAARLINQSMPVRHVMYSGELITFQEDDFVKDVRKEMTKRRLRYFPVLDKDGNVRGLISQRNLLDMQQQRVILVDHNEKSQSPDGIDSVDVVEIVDHHRIGGIHTTAPVYFRNQPLGCTCTIIAHMYQENNIEIPKEMAGIMCAAILSDTLCFRSPTCTPTDENTAKELAAIAGIDPEAFAVEMFQAGSQVDGKSEEDIILSDYKTFFMEGLKIGVSQVNVVGDAIVEKVKEKMRGFVADFYKECRVDGLCLMITDIMREHTCLLYGGDSRKVNMEEVVSIAFGVKAADGMAELEGVVSRKKQMVPGLTTAIQNV